MTEREILAEILSVFLKADRLGGEDCYIVLGEDVVNGFLVKSKDLYTEIDFLEER